MKLWALSLALLVDAERMREEGIISLPYRYPCCPVCDCRRPQTERGFIRLFHMCAQCFQRRKIS